MPVSCHADYLIESTLIWAFFRRRWWRRRSQSGWRTAIAKLYGLHHALPHALLENSFRIHPANRYKFVKNISWLEFTSLSKCFIVKLDDVRLAKVRLFVSKQKYLEKLSSSLKKKKLSKSIIEALESIKMVKSSSHSIRIDKLFVRSRFNSTFRGMLFSKNCDTSEPTYDS